MAYRDRTSRTRPRIPLWRFERIVLLGVLGFLFGFFVVDRAFVHSSRSSTVVTIVVILNAIFVGIGALSTARRRRLLRAHRFHLCYYCDTPLADLSPSGSCPQCGQPYDKHELERMWLKWL